MQLILFGPPGIGKGTQSALLVERLGLKHVSTGDLLRGAIRGGTALGQQAKAFIDAGRLVPGALVRGIANERLAEIGYDNVILDGYPRTVEQAEWVDEDFAAAGHPITVVVSITGDNEVIVERLAARGRPDDAPDIVRKRLAVYAAETAPVVRSRKSGYALGTMPRWAAFAARFWVDPKSSRFSVSDSWVRRSSLR